jgi:hypothetical protein
MLIELKRPYPGNLHIAVAETRTAEWYGWFSKDPPRSKRNQEDKKKFGISLL